MKKGYIRNDYRDAVHNMLNSSSLYYILREKPQYSGTDKDYSTMDEIARYDGTTGNVRWRGTESSPSHAINWFDLNRPLVRRSYREEPDFDEFDEDVDWFLVENDTEIKTVK